MNKRGKIKILTYIICFLIVLIGALLSLIAWITPGPDILLAMAGGSIAGFGTVEVFKLRKLFHEEEI